MKLNLCHETGLRKLEADKSIYIVDKARLESLNYGPARLHFLLHMCLDQGIEVHVGDTQTILLDLIKAVDVTQLVIQESDDIKFVQLVESLPTSVECEWIKDDLIHWPHVSKKSSFFSFFKAIEPELRKREKHHG